MNYYKNNQSLSIKDFDIESLRKKTRECIKQRKDKLTSKSTERRLLQEQCKKLQGILLLLLPAVFTR